MRRTLLFVIFRDVMELGMYFLQVHMIPFNDASPVFLTTSLVIPGNFLLNLILIFHVEKQTNTYKLQIYFRTNKNIWIKKKASEAGFYSNRVPKLIDSGCCSKIIKAIKLC